MQQPAPETRSLDADRQRELMDQVRLLCHQAGERILAIYETDFDVTEKQDQSPLTEADLAAHHTLTDGLTALESAWPVLSEESVHVDAGERRQWGSYWLVDPLDGTREFVKRNGEFTVNVALIADGRARLGCVYAPVLKQMYFAGDALGAWRCRGDEQPERIRVQQPARDPVVVAGSRSHAGSALGAFLDSLGAHELVSMGSSLKLCLVADGTVDVYPRLGPTSEWDTAAAQCVVEQAGGCVLDIDGAVLRYNAKDSLLNPWFVAFGDSTFPWLGHVPPQS